MASRHAEASTFRLRTGAHMSHLGHHARPPMARRGGRPTVRRSLAAARRAASRWSRIAARASDWAAAAFATAASTFRCSASARAWACICLCRSVRASAAADTMAAISRGDRSIPHGASSPDIAQAKARGRAGTTGISLNPNGYPTCRAPLGEPLPVRLHRAMRLEAAEHVRTRARRPHTCAPAHVRAAHPRAARSRGQPALLGGRGRGGARAH